MSSRENVERAVHIFSKAVTDLALDSADVIPVAKSTDVSTKTDISRGHAGMDWAANRRVPTQKESPVGNPQAASGAGATRMTDEYSDVGPTDGTDASALGHALSEYSREARKSLRKGHNAVTRADLCDVRKQHAHAFPHASRADRRQV